MALRFKRTRLSRGVSQAPAYDHQAYELRRKICRFLLRTIAFTFLLRVDRVEGMENLPQEGPGILMLNHIAFVDPIVVLQVIPRLAVPLAKEEVYNYPGVGIFPKIWGVIPVKRDAFDRRAVQRALEVLKAGELILLAPEGTRNEALQPAREGAVYLASRSGAPIIPVALEHTVGFPSFPLSPRWRQPGAHVRFGRPFRYRPEFKRARGETLHLMADEAMYILAGLLPPQRRGVYSDFSKATQDTIEWL